MKTKFDLGDKTLKTVDFPMTPPPGTLIWIEHVLYEVRYSTMCLDRNFIAVEIFKI